MPESVFLLGPDQWDDGVDIDAPQWLIAEVPEGARAYQPKHLRLYLKKILQRNHGKRAVVMDPADQHEGETDGDFFHRLERENGVDAYFILLPAKAKVLGTVFEGGMLERDFHFGRDPTILLFLENSYAHGDHHDEIRFTEKGKRTQYLRTLASRAHHVGFWKDPEELVDLTVEWAKMGK